MRVLDYSNLIGESAEELLAVERMQEKATVRDSIRLIRYLKEGSVSTQVAAGQLVGLGRTQSQTYWCRYRQGGLAALLPKDRPRGRWSKLSTFQITRLRQRLSSHDMATQQQILDWLREEMGIEYTQGGLSMLLARLKIKLKTGRPSNVRKDRVGAESFKKTSIT